MISAGKLLYTTILPEDRLDSRRLELGAIAAQTNGFTVPDTGPETAQAPRSCDGEVQ